MAAEEIEKTDKQTPEGPEPEYYDELTAKENARFIVQDFFAQPWIRWVLVLTLPVLLGILFFRPAHKAKQDTAASGAPINRDVITRESIDRAIEISQKGSDGATPRKKQPAVNSQKRTYKSDIAVFVYKKDEKSASNADKDMLADKGKYKKIGIPSGTKIPALLENRIFSFNVAAPVIAIVPKDYLWEGKAVIPKGSKFLGEASVLKSVDRINVRFDLLVLPDGTERRTNAIALANDGAGGIKGKVEKHGDIKVFKAIGETLLGGASLFVGGGRRDPYSLEDQMRMNLSQNLTNQAAQDLRSINVEKSITAEAYTSIQVLLLESI
jgi:hypothetical protein